ncbi:MAG: cytochrome c-type biogenesis protein CcmH [Magnetococcus sp. DMHC-8]
MKIVLSGCGWPVWTIILLWWLLPTQAAALTVGEVAKDLACPCACPLILEDCNMTCGLDWKNEIGAMIKQGKSKEEIMAHFMATYGDKARMTPWQRVTGKIYQYTRGFDDWDWGMLWAGTGIWLLLVLLGIHRLVRRWSSPS